MTGLKLGPKPKLPSLKIGKIKAPSVSFKAPKMSGVPKMPKYQAATVKPASFGKLLTSIGKSQVKLGKISAKNMPLSRNVPKLNLKGIISAKVASMSRQ